MSNILSFIQQMITSQTNELMFLNRRSEKPFLSDKDLKGKLTREEYLTLITSHLKYCQQLGIQPSTVYLSKAYLDIALKSVARVQQRDKYLLCVCCAWMAIKFNQSSQTSSQFDILTMRQHGKGSFTVQQLSSAECLIYRLLQFKLAYTTPYHYLTPFFQSFPWCSAVKKVLPDLIDFAISIPELSCESAEDLFYGVFTSCLEIKEYALGDFQKSVLHAQIVNGQAVQRIRRIIIDYYRAALSGEDSMEEQTQAQKN